MVEQTVLILRIVEQINMMVISFLLSYNENTNIIFQSTRTID